MSNLCQYRLCSGLSLLDGLRPARPHMEDVSQTFLLVNWKSDSGALFFALPSDDALYGHWGMCSGLDSERRLAFFIPGY